MLDIQFVLLPLLSCLDDTTQKLLSKFYKNFLIPFSFDLDQGGILTAILYEDVFMFLRTSEVGIRNICQNEKCMYRSCWRRVNVCLVRVQWNEMITYVTLLIFRGHIRIVILCSHFHLVKQNSTNRKRKSVL